MTVSEFASKKGRPSGSTPAPLPQNNETSWEKVRPETAGGSVQTALSGSQTKAPGFAGGYLLI